MVPACGPADGDPVEELDGAVHRFHEAAGVRWHWVEAGAGEPLVLLHGMPENWHGWSRVLPRLAESYRVLAFDLPGFGATSAPDGDHSFAGVAEALGDVLAAIGIERFRLAGHDWGGLVGVQMASRADRVVAYAHVSAPIDRYDLSRLPDYRDFWLDPAEAPRFLGIADVVVPRIYDLGWRGGHERMPPELLERRIRDFDRGALTVSISRWFRDLELGDGWELVGRSAPPWNAVRVPTLVVVGDRDLQITSEAVMALDAFGGLDARLAILDDSGHYPASEQPTALAALLADFFDTGE